MAAINELSNDLRELEADFGSQVFTWQGADYPCVPSGIEEQVEIELGGNLHRVVGTLRVRVNAFSEAVPAFGDRITLDGETLIVASVTRYHGVYLRILYAELNR